VLQPVRASDGPVRAHLRDFVGARGLHQPSAARRL